jgi:hypothetical protein
VGQASGVLDLCEDHVRRLADNPKSGLKVWRDGLDGRKPRFICPDSIRNFMANRDVLYDTAAATIGCSRKAVLGYLKMGKLQPGKMIYRSVSRASLDDFIARRSTSAEAA